MTLRLVRPGGPAVAIGYLLGPDRVPGDGARDASLRAALPGCAIVCDAEAPAAPSLAAPLGLVPQSAGPLVLAAWSRGGQTLRQLAREGVAAGTGRDVAAIAIADGTHTPLGGGPWQRATWERLGELARGGGLTFVASCTQNTYVEGLTPAQGGPYASTRTVLDWIARRPMLPGTELHEGGLHLYSYPSGACDGGAHIRALDALPGLLSRHVAPLLSGDAPPVSDTEPAPPPLWHARGGTALSLAVLDAARAVLACGYLETPPGSNRHPWIDGVLRAAGVPLGSSYCAAAASAFLREATRATGLQMPVAGSAGARALLEQFRAARKALTPDRWAEVYPGCLAFWPRGSGWQGHVGVVEEVRADGSLVCLEANAKHAEIVARVVHPAGEVRLGFGLV